MAGRNQKGSASESETNSRYNSHHASSTTGNSNSSTTNNPSAATTNTTTAAAAAAAASSSSSNQQQQQQSQQSQQSQQTQTQPKTSQKVKAQIALQQQQTFLQKHINSNGPRDKPRKDPLDFETMDDAILLKYSDRYGFNLPRPESINSEILNSEIGKKTYSKRAQMKRAEQMQRESERGDGGKEEGSLSSQSSQREFSVKNPGGGKSRISKKEFASHVKAHFLSLTAKENDIITGFLYKVKHQDKEFKLTFQ
ncbi:uncharacterized protein LODBEIA_P55990 [Lodderomyces beijingensis]|uniref:Histone deacetylase complex subunit SAP30 Sin3 binding domain-containing protein n=1 Tax=Lodderomyces beijingensis TaxID=1775926 RepID=A0ABP0ZVJ4_9ASCO